MNPKTIEFDDVTKEESNDVKEFYAHKVTHKVGSLDELLKDLTD